MDVLDSLDTNINISLNKTKLEGQFTWPEISAGKKGEQRRAAEGEGWMSLILSKQIINGEKNMQLREARQRQDSNFVRVYYIYGLDVRRKSFNTKKTVTNIEQLLFYLISFLSILSHMFTQGYNRN